MTSSAPKNVLHLTIQDEMTIYTAVTQKEALLSHLKDSQGLELDLSGINEIDGAGLQLLLLLKREADRSNKEIHIINHSKAVMDLFEIVDLNRYFGDDSVALPI